MSELYMAGSVTATIEAENREFLSFLEAGDAHDILHSAADAAEEFGSVEDVVAAVGSEENALDAYVERADRLHGAALDAQAVVELYIDGRGYRDEMLAASKRVAEGDSDSWDALLAAADNCLNSGRTMPLELRRNLRKLKVKGMIYRQAGYFLETAYQAHLRLKRGVTRGPLISHGSFDGVTYEVRGDTHPILYAYLKVDGRYVEKCTQLGSMDALNLVKQLLAELPGGLN